jgi:hypothetical protein
MLCEKNLHLNMWELGKIQGLCPLRTCAHWAAQHTELPTVFNFLFIYLFLLWQACMAEFM